MMTESSPFEPKRLKIARQFHGYTQVELGDRVSVSRQYINQLEAGPGTPTEDMRAALAAALNVEPSFFTKRVKSELDTDDCNFRSILSRRARDVEQVLAHGALLADLVTFVEAELDKADMEFPAVDFPHIKVTDDESIERAAERARLHWNLTSDQPIDNTIRVAEHAGAVVVKFPGVAHEIDALSVSGDRPLIVRASEKEQQSRLRFDIAHEIGHLVMHQKQSRPDDHDTAEAQANRFASAFLLPRKPFMKAWPRGRRLDWHGIFQIKREWKASAAAILHRASDLGLIDAAQHRSGYIYLSKQGFRRTEPCEPAGEETPEVLRDALIQLQKVSGLLPKDVARVLGVQPVILGKLLHLAMPDLREADAATVINLNARLDWSKAKWYA
jgi:Zn-dependent peptidase ImmA (M78 family)/DNA-binding XRE family transcriptional regulator